MEAKIRIKSICFDNMNEAIKDINSGKIDTLLAWTDLNDEEEKDIVNLWLENSTTELATGVMIEINKRDAIFIGKALIAMSLIR